MPIVVPCGCGAQLRVADGSAGKRVKCPKCATILTVPAPEAVVEVAPPKAEEPVEVSPPIARPARRRVAPRPAAPRESGPRRIIDIVNVNLLAFVAVCFFLPTVVLSCGNVTIEYSGANLALGTDPSIKGLPKEMQDQVNKAPKEGKKEGEEQPKDPLFAAAPALALVAALISLVAFLAKKMPGFPGLALVFALPALGVYGYYTAGGFKIENKLKEAIDKGKKENPGEMLNVNVSEMVSLKRTPWFYLGMACVLTASILSVIRMLLGGAPPAPISMRRPAMGDRPDIRRSGDP